MATWGTGVTCSLAALDVNDLLAAGLNGSMSMLRNVDYSAFVG